MGIFSRLYRWTLALAAHRRAPHWLFGVSFAESSFFPVPPDVMLMPMALARPQRAMHLAALTTLGSVLGGLFGYAIGYFALESVEPWLIQAGYADALTTAREWFQDYGFWVVLLAGFSPIPYKVFTVAAGGLVLPLLPFLIASAVGRGARFFLVAALVGWGGARVEPWLRDYVDWIGWGLVVALVVAYFLLMH